jgi:hypothetical protein
LGSLQGFLNRHLHCGKRRRLRNNGKDQPGPHPYTGKATQGMARISHKDIVTWISNLQKALPKSVAMLSGLQLRHCALSMPFWS